MKSTITSESAGKEYRWDGFGADGLRSYSYNASNPNWNYAKISNPDKAENATYTFTDSSTGKPSARRGNLYSMTAATLGASLKATTSGDLQTFDSICPRGWQLPVITDDLDVSASQMTNKSLARLFRTYGITNMGGNSNVSGANRVKEFPLEFLPTGNYSGYIGSRTTGGYWWTNMTNDEDDGYYSQSSTTHLDVQGDGWRGDGFALRCGAPVPKSTPP